MAREQLSAVEQEVAKLEQVEIKDYQTYESLKVGIDDMHEQLAGADADVRKKCTARLDALRRKLDAGVAGDEPRRFFDVEKAHAALEALGEDFEIVDKTTFLKATRRLKKLEAALHSYETTADARNTVDGAWRTPEQLEHFRADLPYWKQQIHDAAPSFSEAAQNQHQDQQLAALKVKVAREHQMHRLAAAHLKFWHFWFLFLPAALLTMVSGILAFLATSELIGSNTATVLTVLVGLLSLVATFIQTINDRLNFGGRGDMHASAVLDLKQVLDQLEFKQINDITDRGKKPATEATGDPATPPGSEFMDDLERGALSSKTVDTYNEIYVQIQSSCKSAVPLRIQQAFAMADSMLLHTLAAKADDKSLTHELNDWAGPTCTISKNLFSDEFVNARFKFQFNSVRGMLYDHIYGNISSSRGFPIVLPKPHRIVNRALAELNPCAPG